MRVCYVVQRYGERVAGGAEQHCRDFAERLVERGHRVEVVTSCASSYTDWANVFPPGATDVNGVLVHRLPVTRARNPGQFAEINAGTMGAAGVRPLEVQREWMRMQGPEVARLPGWLRRRGRDYDCVVVITYLYWTAWAGLRAAAGLVPTLLHSTAHDEPPLALTLFDELFLLPDSFAFLTPEEADLVRARFPRARHGEVVGVGTDLGVPADPAPFRRRFGLGDDPYLVCVGRVDPAKGVAELVDYFVACKERNPSTLRLVLLGEQLMPVPARDDLVVTGFLDAKLRDSAVAGALALVQPSYFESFSMVLVEAFAQRRPALVQGRCDVLAGHARRSGAALPYTGFAEFEAAVALLAESPARADRLGAQGRAYVEREYTWPTVLDRYESLLDSVSALPPGPAGDRPAPVAVRRMGPGTD